MNLNEQRAAKYKAATEFAESKGADLSTEDAATLTAMLAEVKQLDERIEKADADRALLDSVKALGAGTPGVIEVPGTPEDAPAKSLGEHFVKSLGDNFRARRDAGVKTFTSGEWLGSVSVKANTDTQSTPTGTDFATDQLVDVDLNIQRAKRDRLVIADLLGKGTLKGTSVKYFLEGAFEGDFDMVAEGGLKPQVHVEAPEPITDEIKKIAAWIGFTDEILEDMPLWVSEINQRLLYKLAVKEELQLLKGSGTGQNIRGILNRVGVQTETSASVADNADAIFRAMTKISTATDYEADGVVIHPLDYQNFRLNKDGNGQYFGGGYFSGQYGVGGMSLSIPLWGLRTVVSPVATLGEPLVGNFRQAATMYRKGGVRVESTIADQDDFIHNRVKTRVEERVGLAVRQPEAFVKVDLATAV
ncbi:major capsid protein [Gordonia phage Catfish]|uniref:Major capsid protein n=1 Tax=Gordonia phage Catfish TaxID=2301538 RepID=A0A385D0J6_9CAUD|nr:major capsid protein [Gordonia phage Catfish]AXQ51846.1 major capsid protein [Gordonia phage Catfish]